MEIFWGKHCGLKYGNGNILGKALWFESYSKLSFLQGYAQKEVDKYLSPRNSFTATTAMLSLLKEWVAEAEEAFN
jgi:hypothetical protein